MREREREERGERGIKEARPLCAYKAKWLLSFQVSVFIVIMIVVLLALRELRHEPGIDVLIQRGRNFLTSQQNSDGSWPATTRPPGSVSYAQLISTTGWAILALLETNE